MHNARDKVKQLRIVGVFLLFVWIGHYYCPSNAYRMVSRIANPALNTHKYIRRVPERLSRFNFDRHLSQLQLPIATSIPRVYCHNCIIINQRHRSSEYDVDV